MLSLSQEMDTICGSVFARPHGDQDILKKPPSACGLAERHHVSLFYGDLKMWGRLSSLPYSHLIHEKSRGVPGIRGTPLAGERMVWRQECMVALGSGSFGGGRV